MKLASFHDGQRLGWGCVDGDQLRVTSDIAEAPSSLRALLSEGCDIVDRVSRLADRAVRILPLAGLRLAAPIPDPQKYLALGGNYASHMAEAARVNIHRTAGQVWFNKQVSCVSGPYDPIHFPRASSMLDYEGEMGLVIGRRCRHVRAVDHQEIIAGYLVCNDVSVRDWQMKSPTHTLGKSFDTHGPIGPWLVTADEVGDPHELRLRTIVNGEVRQSAQTSEMTHRVGQMIEELTTAFTLMPGDVLSTGSPAGVGGLMDPPCYLKVGDRVRVEIDRLGYLENEVIPEPDVPPNGTFSSEK